jgi:hypothetical protein
MFAAGAPGKGLKRAPSSGISILLATLGLNAFAGYEAELL